MPDDSIHSPDSDKDASGKPQDERPPIQAPAPPEPVDDPNTPVGVATPGSAPEVTLPATPHDPADQLVPGPATQYDDIHAAWANRAAVDYDPSNPLAEQAQSVTPAHPETQDAANIAADYYANPTPEKRNSPELQDAQIRLQGLTSNSVAPQASAIEAVPQPVEDDAQAAHRAALKPANVDKQETDKGIAPEEQESQNKPAVGGPVNDPDAKGRSEENATLKKVTGKKK